MKDPHGVSIGSGVKIEAPSKLDAQGAHELMKLLQNARASDIELNLCSVSYLGAQALQVMLCAREAWKIDGNDLSITNPSTDAAECLAILGAWDLVPSEGFP